MRSSERPSILETNSVCVCVRVLRMGHREIPKLAGGFLWFPVRTTNTEVTTRKSMDWCWGYRESPKPARAHPVGVEPTCRNRLYPARVQNSQVFPGQGLLVFLFRAKEKLIPLKLLNWENSSTVFWCLCPPGHVPPVPAQNPKCAKTCHPQTVTRWKTQVSALFEEASGGFYHDALVELSSCLQVGLDQSTHAISRPSQVNGCLFNEPLKMTQQLQLTSIDRRHRRHHRLSGAHLDDGADGVSMGGHENGLALLQHGGDGLLPVGHHLR